MNETLHPLDWSLIKVFLAVAETGSLSAAARQLGVSQPTLGRQVRALEDQVGVALFVRQARGLNLSDAGTRLLDPAQRMRAAAMDLATTATGASDRLDGTVRLTASIFMAQHILPPVIADMRRKEPRIEIELVASDASDNLLFREADIAIRMYRPNQLELIARHLGDLPLALCGATAYLDRVGRPETLEAAMALDFVGYDRNEMIIRGMAQTGYEVDRHFFGVRCDMQTVYWELVRAGCGLGFGAKMAADTDAEVEVVLPGIPIPSIPAWLSAHERIRQAPRIRRVWDMLSEALPPLLS